MAILLSFMAALSFGIADYSGGTASKRASVFQVLSVSHALGLVLVSIAAIIWQTPFVLVDFGLGALSGLFGGTGIILFYRALSRGAMSIVTPVAAIVSAVVPALWAALTGEGLSAVVWFGIVLAIVAVGLVSRSNGDGTAEVTAAMLAEALGAGFFFGVFFIFLDFASAESAPWPIVGARLVTGLALTLILAAMGRLQLRSLLQTSSRGLLGLIFLAGTLDTLANVLFLLASDLGNLAVVSVITGMYPVATVALARVLDQEFLQRIQIVGIGLVLVATVLIVGG